MNEPNTDSNQTEPLDENGSNSNLDESTDLGFTGFESDADELRSQLAEAEKKALRFQADLDNYRRRARRDVDEQLKYASFNVISGILDSLDNLERALATAPPTESNSGLVQGVQMVVSQMLATLRTAGCEPIESVGQPFNPNWHQAAKSIASYDQPANHVLEEYRKGYRLHDRVIRPAQVVVSTGPSGAS